MKNLYNIKVLILVVLVLILVLVLFILKYNVITEKFQGLAHTWYSINTNDPPEHVSFTNHNLTTNPRISNHPDPTFEWFKHRPFDWRVKTEIDKRRHPLSPFKIEPTATDSPEGYDTMCLRDYKCMLNYINPENDIRK